MPKPASTKRQRVLEQRTTNCAIACRAVLASDADEPTKRTALSALVRYATPRGVQRPGDLRTEGVAALDGRDNGEAVVHHEHVVPVRVLIDRMVAGDEPDDVLAVAVVTHVLNHEHLRIGPLVTTHAQLYEEMRDAKLSDLPELGRRRYSSCGLVLRKVPLLIAPSRGLDSVVA
ncbi:MAG: hypothetical protein ABW026_06355 [Microvirga sp.]